MSLLRSSIDATEVDGCRWWLIHQPWLVTPVVRVQLVGMVVQVSLGPSATVPPLIAPVLRVVRVALVGMVVQVSLVSSAGVSPLGPRTSFSTITAATR